MIDKEQLIEYFNQNYLIIGPILEISKISDRENFCQVFPVEISRLENFSNQDKTLIMLRRGKDTIVIISQDDETIELARQKLKDQEIIVGIQITVFCEVSGTDIVDLGIFDLESFVASLNEVSDWAFKSNNSDSTFDLCAKIEGYNDQAIMDIIESIRRFLDLLAVSQDIGILVHKIVTSPITKDNRPILTFGRQYRRIKKPSAESLLKIKQVLNSKEEELFIAANGLNHSYVEKCLPSRLSMLWATVETLFKMKPKHLLEENEVTSILILIDQSGILGSAEDKWRLEKLKNGIKDSNLFSYKNRNERIAQAISEELNLDFNETLSHIKRISFIRGKHLHDLTADWDEIRGAEKYLQELLKMYAKKKIVSIIAEK
ncbi:MAG TPA: hypothetical protein PKZ57_02295 [Methanoregulaceae archaeon]|nr:hypothetical protein [Methanoregulaceae archaeon]HQM56316.1 hypothetical protein [Methanoregulaceae archaeon]